MDFVLTDDFQSETGPEIIKKGKNHKKRKNFHPGMEVFPFFIFSLADIS